MKNLILAAALLSHTAVAELARLDSEKGLPNARLGSPIDSVNTENLDLTEDAGRWLTYTDSREEDLSFGKYEIDRIRYHFFKKKLYSIHMEVRGKGDTKGVHELLGEKYGPPTETSTRTYPGIKTRLIIDQWAAEKVYCVYKYAENFQGGTLIFVEKETWDRLEEPRRERREQIKELMASSLWTHESDEDSIPSDDPVSLELGRKASLEIPLDEEAPFTIDAPPGHEDRRKVKEWSPDIHE